MGEGIQDGVCQWCGRRTGKQHINGEPRNVGLKVLDLSHIKDSQGNISYHNRFRLCTFDVVKKGEGNFTFSCYEQRKAEYDITQGRLDMLKARGMTDRDIMNMPPEKLRGLI